MTLDDGKASGVEQVATTFDWAALAPVVTFAALFITLSILTISSNTLAFALFDKTRNRNDQPAEKKKMLRNLENSIFWMQKFTLGLFAIIIAFGFGLVMLQRNDAYSYLFLGFPLFDWIVGLVMGYCFFLVTTLLRYKLRYESTIRGSD